MNDTLEYMKLDPIYRQYHHNEITFSMVYAFSENYVLPLSHDEVVHGKASLLRKMPGDEWRQFAGLRALFGYMWAHPGKQLLFMGSEFGQGSRVVGDKRPGLVGAAVRLPRGRAAAGPRPEREYRALPALWSQDTAPDGFAWIDSNDAHGNVLSFLRFGAPGTRACPCSPASPTSPRCRTTEYRVGLPLAGRWREVLNTDAAATAAAAWATWAPCRRFPCRGTAGLRRRRSCCRRCR